MIIGYRSNRKRQIHKFDSSEIYLDTLPVDTAELLYLYKQSVKFDEAQEKAIENSLWRLLKAVEGGFGSILCARTKNSNDLVGYSLTLEAKRTCNLVLNLCTPHWKSMGLQAWLTHEKITLAANSGLQLFDFNGANSPQRGDDKHSYGSTHKLFFEICFSEVNSF